MRIKRLNNEYNDICANTPIFYPVFIITEDYIELYTDQNRLITKGTELYVVDPFDEYSNTDMKTICPLNYFTEVPNNILEFVEYRNKKDIDKQLDVYKQSKKYNL